MRIKHFLINTLLILFSVSIALLLVEIFLRLNNQGPWGSLDTGRNDPIINQPDKILGWVPKKGKYQFEPFSKNGKKFEINILKDGSRGLKNNYSNGKDKIIFLGGSVTLGWGINDDQTFVSKIQENLVNYELKNFSVGGYGTYQSFLRLEDLFDKQDKIKTVIVTYLPDHAIRNIGDEFWLRTLTKFTRRGYVSLPYASIDGEGKLLRIEPISYFRTPFMDHLSISNKIAKRIMRYKLKDNHKNAYPVTNLIFEDMKNFLDTKNVKLIVLNLSNEKKALEPYKRTFDKKKIDTINCNYEQTEELTIKGDGHPNHLMHSMFAECIFKELKKFT